MHLNAAVPIRFAKNRHPMPHERPMTTLTPSRSPFGLNPGVWIVVVAVLLIVLAAIAMYAR
jgi:hypothetical protein